MRPIPVTPELQTREYPLYENGNDKICAKFSKWANKKNITEITITKSTLKRQIEKINYCEKTDAIEIHFYNTEVQNPRLPKPTPLVGCNLECFRVLLLEYDSDETPTKCASDIDNDTQPKTSKGNILVGNP